MIRTRNQRGKTVKIAGVTALLSGTALTLMSTMPAYAVGTLAGSLVSNTVTVNFDVNGTTQDAVSDTEAFVVDRMIDVLVESNELTAAVWTPNAISETTFTVTNEGNATQGYDLDVALDPTYSGTVTLTLVSGAAPLNEGEYALFIDVDGDGTFSAGDVYYDATSGINAGDLAPDASYEIGVQFFAPSDADSADTFDFTLIATTLDAGTNNVTAETDAQDLDVVTGGLRDGIDTVFVDDFGTSYEVATDGKHSDTAPSDVAAADLAVTKEARVINSDGSNCATVDVDPAAAVTDLYAIPGACIEYKITVTNNGDAQATSVAISDILPAGEFVWVNFITDTDTAYSWFTSDDFYSAEADFVGPPTADGDRIPAHTTGTITATEATLDPDQSIDLVFRVTLNTNSTP